jgi:hypothetical protein
VQQTIPQRERELVRQAHIAAELKLARRLGYRSFFGANKHTQRNPYREGPYRDEWQLGREDAQYGRSAIVAADEPFKKPFIYRTDERATA